MRVEFAQERAAAITDPVGFVDSSELMVIDEIQRVPELLLAIKASVDEDPRAGRYLLTGSSRLFGMIAAPDALPGRMETVELWPFSQIENGWGRIINISSQLAHKGAADMAHYAAAKAGVIGFTRSLAYEVARDGITVNAICPGPIDTELFRGIPADWRARKLAELPIGRAGHVKEIAPAAVLLASDEGSYFVGATINPNGGDYMI